MVTRTPSRATSLFALVAVLVLLASACGDDSDSGDAASDTTVATSDEDATTTTAPAEALSESPAAGVRADLTALLEEQVYLTGFVVEEAAAEGGDAEAPAAVATAEAAADSAVELSEVLGAAYGTAAGADFLEAWNAYRQALVDYGLAGGTAAQVAAAREGVAEILAQLDPEADFAAVVTGLEAAEEELLVTIDELVAGTPAAAVDLRAAAEEMPAVALAMAEIVANHSELEGEVDSEESALRAELTGLMQESALLTGLALAETAQVGDAAAPGPAGVLDAVQENTDALAAAVEPDDAVAATRFGQIWGAHIDAFVDYTVALLADDAAGIEAAEQALVEFRDDIGELLAERYEALTKEAVAEELVPHTDSMLAYADAVVAEAGGTAAVESPALLREAGLAMRLAARTLARGLTGAPAA